MHEHSNVKPNDIHGEVLAFMPATPPFSNMGHIGDAGGDEEPHTSAANYLSVLVKCSHFSRSASSNQCIYKYAHVLSVTVHTQSHSLLSHQVALNKANTDAACGVGIQGWVQKRPF
jgi:hypothetical protein